MQRLADEELPTEYRRKLEIYNFANCADRMEFRPGVITLNRARLPYIESLSNQFDIVARLGMLCPNKEADRVRINGPIYMNTNKWGHLLNEHYLFDIDDCSSQPERLPPFRRLPDGGSDHPDFSELDLPIVDIPRLYGYYGCKTPPRYWENLDENS